MKTYNLIIALIVIGFLSSCKMQGHHNFNKQKFTNLKSTKTVKKPVIEQDLMAEGYSFDEGVVLNSSSSNEERISKKIIKTVYNRDCDHVILDDGSILEVSVQRVSLSRLWYTKCGMSSASEWFSVQRVLINEVEYADEARTTKPVVKLESNKEQVIRAIELSHSFIVKVDDDEYLIDIPRYDGVYGTVSGNLIAVKYMSDSARTKIEFTAEQFEKSSTNEIEIWINSISDLKVSKIELIEPIKKENGTGQSKTIENQKQSTSEKEWNEESIKANRRVLMKRNQNRSSISFGLAWVFFLIALIGIIVVFMSVITGIILLAIGAIGIYSALVSSAVYSRRYNKGRRSILTTRSIGNSIMTFFTWFFIVLISAPLLGIPLALALIIAQTEGTKNY